MRVGLLLLFLAAASAQAGPNPQLLASIDGRLARYGLEVDVFTLSTRQAAALHLALADGHDGWLETRRRLKTILRWDSEDER